MKTSARLRFRSYLVAGVWVASFVIGRAQIPMVTEQYERAQHADLYGIGQYLHTETITFEGPLGDFDMELGDTGLGGVGFAYHFNTYLSIRGEFMFGGSAFRGDIPTEGGTTISVKQDTLIHTGRLNLDYNIINRRLTPFITGGIGYQYLETELSHLPPVQYCWWDPWWGWICTTGEPVAIETDFTWNAGAGLRWDINDHVFIKALVGANWVQFNDAKDITTQIEAAFSLGVTF
jgi:opacity protein-like surface antigen